MWELLGRVVTRFSGLVVAAWVLLAIGLWSVAPKWDDVTDDGNLEYLPQTLTSVRGEQLLTQAFPGPSPLLERGEVLHWPKFARAVLDNAEAASGRKAPLPAPDLPEPPAPRTNDALEPAPAEPGSPRAAPTEPVPSEPVPSEPGSPQAAPAPSEPVPTEPAPPRSAEPAPAANEKTPGVRCIYLSLDDERQEQIRRIASGMVPGPDEERVLRSHLNRLLKDPDFLTLYDLASKKVDWHPPQRRVRARRAAASPAVSLQEAYMKRRKVLELAFPGLIHPIPSERTASQAVVVLERPDGPLTADDLDWFDRIAAECTPEKLPHLPLVSQWSHNTPVLGDKLVSEDRQAALIVLGASTEFMEVRNRDILKALGELVDRYRKDPEKPAGLELGVSGSAAIGGDMIASAAESIANTEVATIALVLLMLIVVYRSPLLVMLPILTIGVSVFTSFQLCALLAIAPPIDFRVFTTSKVFIVVILFGAGTDFCLFLIARYREHLDGGMERGAALRDAVGQVGHVLAASAMTTVLGLGVMVFASFGKYRYSGPTIGVCLLVALVACLTLAPALLQLFRGAVFWPFRHVQHAAATSVGAAAIASEERLADPNGLWRRLTAPIASHPGWVLALTVLALLPLAWKSREVGVTFDLVSDLRADRRSVEGTTMLGRHFPKGDHGPVAIIARVKPHAPLVWKHAAALARRPVSQPHRISSQRAFREGILAGPGLDSRMGRQQIAELTKKLYELREPIAPANPAPAAQAGLASVATGLASAHQDPAAAVQEAVEEADDDPADEAEGDQKKRKFVGVADVRSLSEPLGGTPGVRHLFSVHEWKKFATLRHRLTKDRYLSPVPELRGKTTRFEVILAHDPFSREAMNWVGRIDALLQAESADPKSPWHRAEFDLAGVTATLRDLDAVTASDLRLLQPLVVIVVLAVLIVLLQDFVVSAYLMASVLFSYYVTIGLTWVVYQALAGEHFVGLDWKVPLFLFVILVAVGMDYNIYLITRVVEEQARFGPIEGIRRAVVLTGGIITSCGVIMAGTFVSMMTGSLQSLSQLGFALSFGVLLDTLVVRTFLVPAFLVLWQRHVRSRFAPPADPDSPPRGRGHAPQPHPHEDHTPTNSPATR